MKKTSLMLFATLLCLSGHAETAQDVITKARKLLGPEKTLNQVETLLYEGKVVNADGSEGKLILTFKKPYLQRLEVETEVSKETTAVNGYEGWRELISKNDPRRNGVLVLPPNQVQYLTSNAMENLYFFEGPKHISGGKITLAGEETKRGKDCWVVNFTYPSGLSYTRYFEKGTGELVATRATNDDLEMVEKETVVSGGINFPKIVETYRGDELVRTVTFENIEVNLPVDDKVFDFPGIPTSPKR